MGRIRAAAGVALVVAVVIVVDLAAVACSGSRTEISTAGSTDPSASSASADLAPECPPQVFAPPMSVVAGGSNDSLPPSMQNPSEALMSVITTYGQDHADTYGGLWIDRTQPDSPITVGFTADVDQRRAELLATRAGDHDVALVEPTMPALATTVGDAGWPVVVVQVRHSEQQLRATQDQVMALGQDTLQQMGMSGVGANEQSGYVEMGLVTVTDDLRRDLAARFGDEVCVRQQDVAAFGGDGVGG